MDIFPIDIKHKLDKCPSILAGVIICFSKSMNVFVLHHVHEMESGEEDVKLIGIYSSEESAKQAIIRLSTQPGFRKYIEDFHIDCYELDEDNWTEGFVTTWFNEAGEIEYDDL